MKVLIILVAFLVSAVVVHAEDDTYSVLARSFAEMQCPDLGGIQDAETDLKQVFNKNGDMEEQFLKDMQLTVLELSRGTVKLSRVEHPLVTFESPFVNLLVENTVTKRSRKYVILSGANQILCEEVERTKVVQKSLFFQKAM